MTKTYTIDELARSRAQHRAGPSSPVTPPAEPMTPVSASGLLATESRVREAADESEVVHLIANETRKLLAARQIFVLRTSPAGELQIVGISSLAAVERESAFIQWLETIARELKATQNGKAPFVFDLASMATANEPSAIEYPFAQAMWQPLHLSSGELFGALLATRETEWTEQEGKVFARQARAFSDTWRALLADKMLRPRSTLWHRPRVIIAALVGLALLLPVPMTVLGNVEIVPFEPQRVNAPLDGVIATVLIEPNQPVKQGQTILLFDQTALAHRLQLAEQEVSVAKARLDRVNQSAFHDDKARHEIGLAQAEYDLKQGDRDYASNLFSRSKVIAERDGLLVYSDKDRLLGQPVKTGERLMQIVDPNQIEARVELSISDAIALEQNGRVRLFLDAMPMSSISGKLISEGFMAEPNATQQLVYALRVALDPGDERPRIGSRGIAQLIGQRVPLFFFLFRRPIAAARQHLGF